MQRLLSIGCLSFALCACQMPAERSALPPLPEKVAPVAYAELLTRARSQATQANEALYVDRWDELQSAAQELEQVARYLPTAKDVPAKHRDTLTEASRDLGKEAAALRAAATDRDAKKATAAMGAINSKVRELRLAN